jgi:F-type H+-transporting ATPase subunit delta
LSVSDDAYLHADLFGHEVDVGAYHLGMVYAKALVGAAEKAGNTDEVLAELDALVDDVLRRHPQLDAALATATITNENKVAVVGRVFAGRVTTVFLSFLKVVAGHGRGGCLRAIRKAARDLLDQKLGRVRVRLTTATPLDDELARRIDSQLRAALDGTPVLARFIDPDLIGGIVFKVGDTVFDGSVATRLEQLRQQMIHRSVHEIQRRRDRFSSPAGN